MVRRFVYDEASGSVVEVGTVKVSASAASRYTDADGEYQYQFNRAPGDGASLRTASLDRAERREWAHKKFGTESRWSE